MKITFGKRPHRGGLKESLKEAKKISRKEFETLLPDYKFYFFDERVNQLLFFIKDLEKSYYTWIYIQIDK